MTSPMRRLSHISGPLVAVLVLGACATEVTLRRVVHYPEVGVARHLPHIPPAPKRVGINWRRGDLRGARAQAQRAGRGLVVYMATTWCGPCKRLDRDTFPTKAVIKAFNNHWLSIKLDGDSPAGQRFRKHYRVNSYPTFLFFKPDGKEIDRAFGFHNTQQLVRVMANMRHDRNTVGDLRRRVAKGPPTPALLHKLGQQLALRGEGEEATQVLERVPHVDPDDKSGMASQALYTIGRYVHMLRSRDLNAAAKAFERAATRYPKSHAGRSSALELASIHIKQKAPGQAVVTLQRMIKADKRDALRYIESARLLKNHGLELKRALKWAKRGTKLRKDGYPWSLLGEVYGKMGDTRRQRAAFEEAVKRSPDNGHFRRLLKQTQKR